MSADVIAWLRSPDGERWSRHLDAGRVLNFTEPPPTQWRPGGLLRPKWDPCGAGPVQVKAGSEEKGAIS